jgi:dTDP-4-dehydrorhamnose reductase
MTWLLFGGSGQLGCALQKELRRRTISYKSFSSLDLDISNVLEVEAAFAHFVPDVVVNAAAWTDVEAAELNPERSYQINALGALNIARAAKRLNSVFVQISTDYVFSGSNFNQPWDEEAFKRPISVYGYTKSEGETLVQSLGMNSLYILRTAWLYSADRKNFVKTMVNLALNSDQRVNVVNDQLGQPTFAGDLGKQTINLVLSKSQYGIYHGTNSGEATWYEFAQEIFKLIGADVSRVVPCLTSDFRMQAKRPHYSVLGHKSWANTTVSPMRDWRIALNEAMPAIISSVKTGK